MKKTGFTLAEVLITLAIIGVVAMLTLPALINNTQEQQAKTALKKAINTLTEAAQLNMAVDGFGYDDVTAEDEYGGTSDHQTLYGLLSRRTQLNFSKSGDAQLVTQGGQGTDAGNYTVFFRDGSALSFPSGAVGDRENGIAVLLDTNGSKGPNSLSNCEAAGMDITTEGDGDCSTKSQRVIKDQFGLKLTDTVAVPNGPAARWAFEN